MCEKWKIALFEFYHDASIKIGQKKKKKKLCVGLLIIAYINHEVTKFEHCYCELRVTEAYK